MKRILISIFAFLLFLTGCEERKKEEIVVATPLTKEEPVKEIKEEKTSDIDLDLTFMSATAIYAEVSNMMLYPEMYDGKKVRINGMFAIGYDMYSNPMYGCIIPDATACCIQGIAFNWKGDHQYPDDYPKEGEPLVVEGTFTFERDESYINVCLDEADVWFGEEMKEVLNNR